MGIKISKEQLHQWYSIEFKTTTEIATILNVSPSTISNKLKKFDIPIRNRKQAQFKNKKINEKILFELYITQRKSVDSITKILNISETTIFKYLQKFGIKVRKNYDYPAWNKGSTKQTNEKIKKASEKTSITRKILFKKGELSHWNKGNSWSKEHREKLSEKNKGKRIGPDNHNWKGGVSSKYTAWKEKIRNSFEYKELRKKVYLRDNYLCQLCGKLSDGDLQMHHIKKVEDHKDLILEESNCITLCRKCHVSIRHKESDYETQFEKKIYHNNKR